MPAPVPVLLMARELGIGGTERQLTETAKALDRDRFSPHVGCFRDGFRGEELRAAGVPVVQFPVMSFRSPSAWQAARLMGRYLRQHRIGLVHTFDTPLNVWGVPVARFYRAPHVLSSQRAYRELSGRFRAVLRLTDRMVDGIVVNCRAVERQLREEERVAAHRIHLCYNGIDTATFQPAGRALAGDQPDAPVVIGVVCALRPEKGLSTLMAGFAQAHAAHPQTRLLFVGSGPMQEALEAQARDLGVAGVCRFQPTTNDVAFWLRQIDIFVLPSRSEALSNALMEAMACGCACIASRVGGNPELVIPQESGLLFERDQADDLAQQLQRLLQEPALRRRLQQTAANMIRERFTLAAAAAEMGAIYTRCLSAV